MTLPHQLGESSILPVLREGLLRIGAGYMPIQDQIDCVEWAAAAGYREAARVLNDVIALQLGFSNVALHDQAFIAARMRSAALDGRMRAARRRPQPTSSWSISLAAQELRGILPAAADLDPLPRGGRHTVSGHAKPAFATGGSDLDTVPADFAPLCQRLCTALRRPFDGQIKGELGTVLAGLSAGLRNGPELNLRKHVGESVALLCAAAAFNIFRRFYSAVADLAHAPFGSPGLFHAAARLEAGALGPWFTNVSHLIRSVRDIFGLIQLGFGKGPDGVVAEDILERWAVLLSLHLPDGPLRELIDELADLGAMRAIWAICEREARRPRRHAHVVWCIRDAGLDHADLDLALTAQRLIVCDDVSAATEWVVLGEIEATAGNIVEAENAFVLGLDLDPAHGVGRERLAALRDGAIEVFQVTSGYGTPASRKQLRLARRQRLQHDVKASVALDA